MKKRELRRHLTEKYQRKQIRYIREVKNEKVFDDKRHRLTTRQQRHYFISLLKGAVVYLNHGMSWFNGWGIENREINPSEMGRYRNHSHSDCGRPKCPACGNPRKNGYNNRNQALTRKELQAMQEFQEDLEEYYKEKEK